MAGDFFHSGGGGRVGEDISFFKGVVSSFQPTDGVNAPRAPGFDIKDHGDEVKKRMVKVDGTGLDPKWSIQRPKIREICGKGKTRGG